MWSRRSAETTKKKERGGRQKQEAAAAASAPHGKASATLRKIRIRRRINAAAAADAAAAAVSVAAPNASLLGELERCDTILRRQFSFGRTVALEPILEEVAAAAAAATSTRSLSETSSSRNSHTAYAVRSSQSSAELGELSTREVFADKTATSSTTGMSRSVQAIAGSATGSGGSPELLNMPSVQLEQFSVAPMTPSGEPTTSSLNQSCDASPDVQPSSSGHSYSLSIADNFLLEDPVIRDFLGDCSVGGSNSRSCASVSFAVPTRDTGDAAEVPTESVSGRPELENIKIRIAEERDWQSGGSFASNNAAWTSRSNSSIRPFQSTASVASASISVTASPVKSAIRHQLLTRSSSTTEVQNSSSAESLVDDRWRDRPARFQFTARCPSPTKPTIRSRSNSSRNLQQQRQQQQIEENQQLQQPSPSRTESDMALILEVNRGGQSNSIASRSNRSQTPTQTPAAAGPSAAAPQPVGRNASEQLTVAPGGPRFKPDQTHQPKRSSSARISLAARAAEAIANSANSKGNSTDIQPPPAQAQPSNSGARTAEATVTQPNDYCFKDGDRLPADLRQAARRDSDCSVGLAAASKTAICGGGHRLPDYRGRLHDLIRLYTPGCGGCGGGHGGCSLFTSRCPSNCMRNCCGGGGCGGGGCGSGGCGGGSCRGGGCGGGGCGGGRGCGGGGCGGGGCSGGGCGGGGCGGCGGGCGGGGCGGCCHQHHQQAFCSNHCTGQRHRHQSASAGCRCSFRSGSANCCLNFCGSCSGGDVGFRNCCSASSSYSGGKCCCCCCCCSSASRFVDPQSCFPPYRFQYQPYEGMGQQQSEQQQQQKQQPDKLQSTNCYSKFVPSWAANSNISSTSLLSKSKAAAAAAAAASAFPWLQDRGEPSTTPAIAAEKQVRIEKPQ